jgi:acyl carrier protein
MRAEIRKLLDQVGDLDVPVTSLTDHDDLYAAGLSSLSTIQVLMAVEKHFQIELPDELVTEQLFSSVDALTHAVEHVLHDGEAA